MLAEPRLSAAADRLGPTAVKSAVRRAQDAVRDGTIEPEAAVDLAVSLLPERLTTMRPVINATGVVLHTNLGRAPLSNAAIDAVVAASGYVDVEYDVTTGARARRGRGALEALTAAVPEAESVHVVNNGAAALVLLATALASGREIVVSRGELVEIGDGFRLPDLLMSTGAQLREVGTTNRTTIADYQAAIGDETAFILKVHPSNFVISGFTSAVPVGDLATLGPPVVVDIGSGLLQPDPLMPDEPDAKTVLRAGAAAVSASGDKLLGGPQAGLLLGRANIVDVARRHPLARALRVDKLTLAGLEATLLGPQPPAYEFIHADASALAQRDQRLAEDLRAAGVTCDVVPSAGVVGGGGAPGLHLDGWAVRLPEKYAEALRTGDPRVVTRLEDGACLVDLRCVPVSDDAAIEKAVTAL